MSLFNQYYGDKCDPAKAQEAYDALVQVGTHIEANEPATTGLAKVNEIAAVLDDCKGGNDEA
jgi:hypothetical protein